MEFATLLQQGPFDDLFGNLGKLLPMIIFIGAAMIPALKKSRDKSNERKAASRRAMEQTWKRVEHEMESAPPKPEPKPKAAQTNLEDRVRRYFEGMTGNQPTKASAQRAAPAPRPAASGPLPPIPNPESRSLVEIDHLDVNIKHLDVHLKGLEHKPRKRLPSRMKPTRKSGRRRAGSATRSNASPTVRSLLASRGTLRQAIVLREILGPPKALEDQ